MSYIGEIIVHKGIRRKIFKSKEGIVFGAGILIRCNNAYYLINDAEGLCDPGGKVEPCDGSPLDTAIREFEEEVGVGLKAFNARYVTMKMVNSYIMYYFEAPEALDLGKGVWSNLKGSVIRPRLNQFID